MAYSVPASHTLDSHILVGLAESTSTAVMSAGTIAETTDGRRFQFVYYQKSGVSAVSGAPAIWVNTTADNVVTSDTSDGDTEGGAYAGVFCQDQSDQNNIYLWIQTKGLAPDCHCESGVVAGDLLFAGQDDCFNAIDDVFFSTSATTYQGVAVAMEADTSSKADILLL